MQQATDGRIQMNHPGTILAILITSAALAAVTLLLLGIDITPALTFPTADAGATGGGYGGVEWYNPGQDPL